MYHINIIHIIIIIIIMQLFSARGPTESAELGPTRQVDLALNKQINGNTDNYLE